MLWPRLRGDSEGGRGWADVDERARERERERERESERARERERAREPAATEEAMGHRRAFAFQRGRPVRTLDITSIVMVLGSAPPHIDHRDRMSSAPRLIVPASRRFRTARSRYWYTDIGAPQLAALQKIKPSDLLARHPPRCTLDLHSTPHEPPPRAGWTGLRSRCRVGRRGRWPGAWRGARGRCSSRGLTRDCVACGLSLCLAFLDLPPV